MGDNFGQNINNGIRWISEYTEMYYTNPVQANENTSSVYCAENLDVNYSYSEYCAENLEVNNHLGINEESGNSFSIF